MQEDTSPLATDLETSTEVIGNSTNVTESNTKVEANSDVMLVFYALVILIGIIGCVANGLVLSVLLSKKLRTQISNLLMINQVATDLYACILLVVSYISRLPRLYLTDRWGWFLCVFLQNDMLTYIGLIGSNTGVLTITAERYFKVVHPIAHRKNFRNWMIYVAIALTWIIGVLANIAGIWTSGITDGECFGFLIWPTEQSATAFAIFVLIVVYFLPLLLFIYCYWHILAVIKGQSKVFHGHPDNETVAQQATANKTQMNVIATMIGICLAYFFCWTPNQIWYMFSIIVYLRDTRVYLGTLFVVYLNTILNPFIYSVKHEAVKKGLRQMLWKKSDPMTVISVTNATIT